MASRRGAAGHLQMTRGPELPHATVAAPRPCTAANLPLPPASCAVGQSESFTGIRRASARVCTASPRACDASAAFRPRCQTDRHEWSQCSRSLISCRSEWTSPLSGVAAAQRYHIAQIKPGAFLLRAVHRLAAPSSAAFRAGRACELHWLGRQELECQRWSRWAGSRACHANRHSSPLHRLLPDSIGERCSPSSA